ncbi:YciI family protein [Flexivirga meconopsidis]|uniref:YciI family protein n=1 Tax=Flexivirga meconopsidis TaxID=2977121 RepID=UPI00223F0944|nr:YciI family protein [Flexivirga meconopsidis]
MTKYLVLLAGREGEWEAATDEQRAGWHRDHLEFGRVVGDDILGGEALAGTDTATTVRRRGGKAELTDGPFAETAEQIGGFYLVQAPDLDQVLAWCELLPEIYTLEVRPCIEVDLSA